MGMTVVIVVLAVLMPLQQASGQTTDQGEEDATMQAVEFVERELGISEQQSAGEAPEQTSGETATLTVPWPCQQSIRERLVCVREAGATQLDELQANLTKLQGTVAHQDAKIADLTARLQLLEQGNNKPASCSEAKSQNPEAGDGEYTLYPFSTNKDVSLRVYCHGMASGNPKEFLSLPAGPDYNYATVVSDRLVDSSQWHCTGPLQDPYASRAGTTKFSKLRIQFDASKVEVIRDDYTFAQTTGPNDVDYGHAGDCYSANQECAKGTFRVNLTGTDLALAPKVHWVMEERYPESLTINDMFISEDRKVASARCGGWCGHCWPAGKKMHLTKEVTYPQASCPQNDSLVLPSGKTYYAGENSSTYSSAQEDCGRRGGIVAIPRDDEEQRGLVFLKNCVNSGDQFWLGIEKTAGTWKDSRGTSLGSFTSWAPGEPDDFDNGFSCAHVVFGDKVGERRDNWADAHCGAHYRYVCEIEDGLVTGEVNLALGKTATQSSDYVHLEEALGAGKAVDGSRATDIGQDKACTHTQRDYQPWWKVDLSRTYTVQRVSILNRGDCCGERLKDFAVRVGPNEDFSLNGQCGETYTDTPTDGQTIVVYCNPPISGRYVSVQLMGREDYLSLCEVEVYAETGDDDVRPSEVDEDLDISSETVDWLARDSSWVVDYTGGGVAAQALDGDDATFWNPHGVERYLNNWYIALDLTAPATLTRIAIDQYGDTRHDIAAFKLQTSQVGSPYDWKDVASFTNVQGGTDGRQEFGGFQGTARYWRFVVTETHKGFQPWLRELNFYGVPPASSWSASSQYDSRHSADRADINSRETSDKAGAWAAVTNDQDQWLMRDLGEVKVVTGVITKGRDYSPDWPHEPHDQYVTSYVISYGVENGDEKFYTNAKDEITVFAGNSDRDGEVHHDFRNYSGPDTLTARFVKIHPRTWHQHISMRAKIITSASSWSASSQFDSRHSADRADINSRETSDKAGAWAAVTNDQDQWLMRDLGEVKAVTGVITKGRDYSPDWPHEPHDQYVTSYVISYGVENGDEKFYTNAEDKITVFAGNSDRDGEVHHDFSNYSGPDTLRARFVKIHPRTWHQHISMRAKIITSVCPSGYVPFRDGDRCFNFSIGQKNYTDARSACQAAGGHLAMPKDQATNDFLVNQIRGRYPNGSDVWFGLTDQADEGSFLWEDGTPLVGWTDWCTEQPDDYETGEDCVEWWDSCDYKWNDVPCTVSRYYVCEAGAIAPGP
ncbi:uncharacterized protein LOC118430887 [Branchiostoma floridae]|uniref:Uncharacterized protein LOC118430887 n=2 Tax=Branchiostoma floridae TaxID=7739 RepID=A0A9J7MD43_BRAFL|nr:uncharacterized protein LOC118430887 [Branchiostoma floridae]